MIPERLAHALAPGGSFILGEPKPAETPVHYAWQDARFTALDRMCEYADRAALAYITALFNDPHKAAMWLFGGRR